VTRGGQTVSIADVFCTRPRAFNHRHKLHEALTGWTKQAPLEVRCSMAQFLPMVKEEVEEEGDINIHNKFLREPPQFSFNNYFDEEKILNLLGGHCFRATTDNHHNRLLEVPGINMCNEKTEAKWWNSRVARFDTPMTMVKDFLPTDSLHVGCLSVQKHNPCANP
jgi:hypothetical protein